MTIKCPSCEIETEGKAILRALYCTECGAFIADLPPEDPKDSEATDDQLKLV